MNEDVTQDQAGSLGTSLPSRCCDQKQGQIPDRIRGLDRRQRRMTILGKKDSPSVSLSIFGDNTLISFPRESSEKFFINPSRDYLPNH